MKNRVPRKLKKELRKIDCIEKTADFVSPDSVWKVKIKKEVKQNKWTKKLVANIYREKKRADEAMAKAIFEKQIAWLGTEDCYIEKLRKEISQEQFRREYLCEPKVKSLPSIIEFQNGERLEWQPSSQRDVEEYIRRCNLDPYIQEPDSVGNVILKLPSLSPEQIEKFKDEWKEFINSSKPITSIDPKASVEFIPHKRPHRLHNHPGMEVDMKVPEDKVIVDIEYCKLFSKFVNVDNRHIMVCKKEFLEIKSESQK